MVSIDKETVYLGNLRKNILSKDLKDDALTKGKDFQQNQNQHNPYPLDNRQNTVTGKGDEAHREFYLEGEQLGNETRHKEFKEGCIAFDKNARKELLSKYVCAFLNSGEGGTLYLGVDDGGDYKVIELTVRRNEDMDRLYYTPQGMFLRRDGSVHKLKAEEVQEWAFQKSQKTIRKLERIIEEMEESMKELYERRKKDELQGKSKLCLIL
ncbi:schlafen-like protein 1 [Saccostrea echinata]|uniref:schlafen-like protein 1 n=1 Tax=Saccostrea echinata TaxID=191078 RepID=UPI002A833958|nr:schlafen-like protein 1 [Saccostrea echinata]